MNHIDRIAFAMFKSDYPPHIASEMTLENLGKLQKPMGEEIIGEVNLALDWNLNRESYQRLASAAVRELNNIVAERRGS